MAINLSLQMTQIINSTQGGAKIKGTHQWALIDAFKKFATKKIDKSIINPLLSYADDGDELVKKVIPLIRQDIKIIKSVVKHSKSGLRSNRQLYKKGLTQERLNRLLSDNYKDSVKACEDSRKIPLINVAIFGAQRLINSRELVKRKGDFKKKKEKEDFEVNIKRNKIILQAAFNVATKLLKEHKNTLKLLKKYNETKNDELLRPRYVDFLSLENIESDFENGNFARPLLTVRQLNERNNNTGDWEIDVNSLLKIEIKALDMRNKMIAEAHEKESKEENADIRYNDLVEYAHKVGRDFEDWEKVEELLREAITLKPNGYNALWGLASLQDKQKKYEESRLSYEKLLELKPDNPKFIYNYGLVLLSLGKIQAGIDQIVKAMSMTDIYDGFAKHLGQIYFDNNLYNKALAAYDLYLKTNENDYDVLIAKGLVLLEMGRNDEADECLDKAEALKPENKKIEIHEKKK